MRNTLVLFFIFIASLLSESVYAQTSVGFRGGYSVSNYSYRFTPGARTTRSPGITAPTYSFVIEQFLAKNAGAQIELQYIQLGYTQRDTLDRTNQTRLDYLKVPFMSNFYFGNKGRFHIKLGTHFGYLLNASDTQREYEASGLLPTYGGVEDSPRRLLYGLSAGAGLSKLFGKSTLAGEVRFSYDFSRPETQDRIFDMTSTNLEFTLSYLFQIIKPKWQNQK
ncbi:porin family protein [Belliella pelovolcani]|uniref:Outer membrane protein beta-barrel domain-containing protein n=1 Tax=Belliella pelovolcani TaxID=529505 RepID=A0A1N7KTD3_9BACT|nr:porin family protein [Belliella pelovolcani]SIS64824.1 Outer membrane protein beta-barrel domain-containing protein [Belliella pelovolcani]